ncbi:MAG: host attachment protein [Methyloceanibacter sp.]|uniref:host attachment protein n=1 Tax=Methyloceanibacter sp. TaxID=1965321 RepID=UPI003D6CA5EC
MKKAKIWYAIADGGRARFVERDENGAFRTIASLESTDLHDRASDLDRDRPGRVMESATPGRSAVEPRRDLKQAAKEDFVKLVADELALGHDRGQFDQLMLVAPPGVLTELKQKLAKPIADLVVKDLQKDLTKVPDHDLTQHLAPR